MNSNMRTHQPDLQNSNLQVNSLTSLLTNLPLPKALFEQIRCWLTGASANSFADSFASSTAGPTQPLAYPVHSVRTNADGIEIIKQFEGFPADVEPNVIEAEQAVRQLVAVPLTPNQFSALVSFTYQMGAATLSQSALLKHLNAGRYRVAAREFELWTYIGTRRLPKLAARRLAERRLFLSVGALNLGY